MFICVEVKKSIQQQLESRQETTENAHAEVEKCNLEKKRSSCVISLQDSLKGCFPGIT